MTDFDKSVFVFLLNAFVASGTFGLWQNSMMAFIFALALAVTVLQAILIVVKGVNHD